MEKSEKSIEEHKEEVEALFKKLESARSNPTEKVLSLGFEYRWFIGATVFCYLILSVILAMNAKNIPFSNWLVGCTAFGIGGVAISSGWGFYNSLRDYDKKYTKAAMSADINFSVAMRMAKFINKENMDEKYREFLSKERS